MVSDFMEFSSETERLESICSQKLAALAELKQSLLQKAFSGELTAERAEKEEQEAFA
jgi:type I restriction enzyme S subunit